MLCMQREPVRRAIAFTHFTLFLPQALPLRRGIIFHPVFFAVWILSASSDHAHVEKLL
jgi:hypothetical protein